MEVGGLDGALALTLIIQVTRTLDFSFGASV